MGSFIWTVISECVSKGKNYSGLATSVTLTLKYSYIGAMGDKLLHVWYPRIQCREQHENRNIALMSHNTIDTILRAQRETMLFTYLSTVSECDTTLWDFHTSA